MRNIFEHVLRYFIIDNNYKLLITFHRNDVCLNEPIEIDEQIKLALECLYIYYYAHPLLRGRLHLVRDKTAEKEFDIAT